MTRRIHGAVAGFTLVEVLVAVVVFGLLSAAAYAGLNSLTLALDAQRQHADALQSAQRIIGRLDLDLRQLVSRTGRDERGRVLPALQAGPQGILARRAGWSNPANLPRSHLQQFRWARVDDELQRASWFRIDANPSTAPVAVQRFGNVSRLEFRFRDRNGQWHSRWPLTDSTNSLPTAVEYVIEIQGLGELRRLVAL